MRAKSLRCLVGWHSFHVSRTDDNEPYKRCVRCGKDADGTPRGGDGYGGAFSSPSL